MRRVLFLGNSHVAAFKLAHEALDPNNSLGCTFACARGADLAFTEVEAGVLKACDLAFFDPEIISYAFPGWMEAHYLVEARPTEDVSAQFKKTSGEETIALSGLSDIFYVVGVSPYDFMRLDKTIIPVSSILRKTMLQKMLLEKHIMRRQIEAIRTYNPGCLHHLIAMPLKAIPGPELSEADFEIVSANRETVSRYAEGYLFNDVFMPDGALLDKSLLSTRTIFTPGGCAASEIFQKDPAPIETDRQHMNKAYGEAVFNLFVRPRLEA